MKIASVDPFCLRMEEVTSAADGTQDSFLVRIRDEEGNEGWGESDASPLVSLAVYCCPTSHGNVVNLRESLIGETVDGPDDVRRLHAKALRQAMDIQHVHHAYSAADVALWDLLGKKTGRPVWKLLDGPEARAFPKRPYASVLFGDTPKETRWWAERIRDAGFTAAKFGWGPMGRGGAEEDVALVRAAREGLGKEATLFVDAGVAWDKDDQTAYERAIDFASFNCAWLEEPLAPGAVEAYARLRERRPPVPIAAGEGCGRFRDAEDLITNGGVHFIQIDAGRIGGITPAHQVRKLAESQDVSYVNHTFKSHLSLAAALHVFTSVNRFTWLEYVVGGSPLAESLTRERLERGPDGRVTVPDRPGLGVTVDPAAVEKYLSPVHIEISGQTIFETATL